MKRFTGWVLQRVLLGAIAAPCFADDAGTPHGGVDWQAAKWLGVFVAVFAGFKLAAKPAEKQAEFWRAIRGIIGGLLLMFVGIWMAMTVFNLYP
ncbi:MAG: hypothetical protein JSS03_05035 [Proteobacteria bacterium]|nr:hypothetical protein [Pseudomonadota bacterium]